MDLAVSEQVVYVEYSCGATKPDDTDRGASCGTWRAYDSKATHV